MPFVARCVFCSHEVKVPDHALGGSGRCPKCANYFTLTPASFLPGARTAAAAPKRGPTPVQPEDAALPEPPQPAQPTVHIESVAALPRTRLRWLDPVGVAALLLGAAALLCAGVVELCRGVIPLAAVGLVVGLASVALALTVGKVRLLTPLAGTLVSGGVLVTALLFPQVLGPTWFGYREQVSVDVTAARVVPLPGKPAGAELEGPDGIDASLAAWQQGNLRVEVAGVTYAPPEQSPATAKKGPPVQALLVRLRIQRGESPEQFAARDLSPPGARAPEHLPKLTDGGGATYRLRPNPDTGPVEGLHQSTVFPMAVVDELFAFEMASLVSGALRLEVPAAAWGGRGTVHFRIPPAMIQREPIRPVRLGPKGAG